MYELALTEWGLTPDYINEHFTEELLALLFMKRNERMRRTALQSSEREPSVKRVTNSEFFQQHGIKVKTA